MSGFTTKGKQSMNGNPEEYKTPVRGVAQQYDEQEGLRPIGYYIGLIIGGQVEEDEQSERTACQDAKKHPWSAT